MTNLTGSANQMPESINLSPMPTRKRPRRSIVACNLCRFRKVKCDGNQPCTYCDERGAECAFPARKRRFADPATVLNTSHTPTNDQESSINAATEQEIITSSPQPTERELRGHPDEQGAPAGTTSGSPGFGEVNTHTGGVEYYGPGGNYAFIRTLWQFALKHGASSEMPPHPSALRGPIEDPTEEASSDSPISVVNYLHTSTPRNSTDSRNNTSASVTSSSLVGELPSVDLQKECIRTYFRTIHVIYPFLSKPHFMKKAEDIIWSRSIPSSHIKDARSLKHFSALYLSVLALGALLSDDPETFLCESRRLPSLFQQKDQDSRQQTMPSSLSWRIADTFFQKGRGNLSDMFDSSSLENTQALLLMSIFCQMALRPHSSYIFSGLAQRTAGAIGLHRRSTFNFPRDERIGAITWWCIFAHESELCASSGRDLWLNPISSYDIPIAPPWVDTNETHDMEVDAPHFLFAMVSLADIFRDIGVYLQQPNADPEDSALRLQSYLANWRHELPDFLSSDHKSLTEPDWAFKQRIILQLRSDLAQLLIHRPFLVTRKQIDDCFLFHVRSSVEAGRRTVKSLYEAYLHKPFFRTWWSNTTYIVNAVMVMLYILLFQVLPEENQQLSCEIKQSLEILNAMKASHVSTRIAILIERLLSIASRLNEQQSTQRRDTNPTLNCSDSYPDHEHNSTVSIFDIFENDGIARPPEGMIDNLLGPAFMDEFVTMNQAGFFTDINTTVETEIREDDELN